MNWPPQLAPLKPVEVVQASAKDATWIMGDFPGPTGGRLRTCWREYAPSSVCLQTIL